MDLLSTAPVRAAAGELNQLPQRAWRARDAATAMRLLREYHHFKADLIEPSDRVARCERHVVDLLLNSRLPDSGRESSICWELKHQASMRQFASILARKRHLPLDVCIVGVLLHDIWSVIHGEYRQHAERGAAVALDIVRTIGGFSEEEQRQIWRIVRFHSDKHIWTDDPFQEIGKDIDVLDCFLYEGAFDYYLCNKPLPVFREYARRAMEVWMEVGIPLDPRLTILDDYGPCWFDGHRAVELPELSCLLGALLEATALPRTTCLCPPPFCIVVDEHCGAFHGNRRHWATYHEALGASASGIDDSTIQVVDQFLETRQEERKRAQYVEEASAVLAGVSALSGKARVALLFWPLLGIYEQLTGERAVRRTQELGFRP